MRSVQLTRRQEQVLRATVQHYVATAEPVGSKALVAGYDFAVSPATIRNAMGVLEKVGLLYQPHASAGRIPSDSGYRLYVDRLMTPSEQQSRRVEQVLSDRLKVSDRSLEAVLRGAAQILASLSGYITLITFPQSAIAMLRHLQLVQVDLGRAIVVLVTDTYETHSGLFDIPLEDDIEAAVQQERIDQELQVLSNFLNHHLRSQPLAALAMLDWQDLGQEFQRYSEQVRQLFTELSRRSCTPQLTQILISGVAEVLRQPEFSELQQFQNLMHLLEADQALLWPLMFEVSDPNDSVLGEHRVRIRIGAENPLEPMQSCALVSAVYHRGTTPVGSVGVVGPTRMVYEETIAAVEATADYLSEVLR